MTFLTLPLRPLMVVDDGGAGEEVTGARDFDVEPPFSDGMEGGAIGVCLVVFLTSLVVGVDVGASVASTRAFLDFLVEAEATSCPNVVVSTAPCFRFLFPALGVAPELGSGGA